MKAAFLYGAGDVRVESVPDPVIQLQTDAIVRVVRACVCGSDLHPYHTRKPGPIGAPMGHEMLGIVEDIGSEVSTVRRGDLVVATFTYQDLHLLPGRIPHILPPRRLLQSTRRWRLPGGVCAGSAGGRQPHNGAGRRRE
jgi:threonine dehydrogenase-like Zn-dependent dehydrogenase